MLGGINPAPNDVFRAETIPALTCRCILQSRKMLHEIYKVHEAGRKSNQRANRAVAVAGYKNASATLTKGPCAAGAAALEISDKEQ